MESSPTIDLDVIQMFNKKFDGKYENVRKPIIVNGLREIKPFKQSIQFKKPIPESEPEPERHPVFEREAEPEPELESIP
jgi:hypothetical protein